MAGEAVESCLSVPRILHLNVPCFQTLTFPVVRRGKPPGVNFSSSEGIRPSRCPPIPSFPPSHAILPVPVAERYSTDAEFPRHTRRFAACEHGCNPVCLPIAGRGALPEVGLELKELRSLVTMSELGSLTLTADRLKPVGRHRAHGVVAVRGQHDRVSRSQRDAEERIDRRHARRGQEDVPRGDRPGPQYGW